MRDEAEIRGHRRTYVGAMPGRILDALKRAGVDDPVILLDELDKMDSDWRGDPAAALMEVLDPVQNHAFRDTYLELEYDLSHVLFIATANYEEDIPETLHDRLEVIRLPGYTEPGEGTDRPPAPAPPAGRGERPGRRGRRDHPAGPALHHRGATPARPACASWPGIWARSTASWLARGSRASRCRRGSGPREVERLLWAPPFLKARVEDVPLVGVSTGLAYTGAGGDILRIETVVAPGKGDFHLTGQLGEVMQESVTAAWGYLKTAIMRDTDCGALWEASPGRAYLVEHFSPPEVPPFTDARGRSVVPDGVAIESSTARRSNPAASGSSDRDRRDARLRGCREPRARRRRRPDRPRLALGASRCACTCPRARCRRRDRRRASPWRRRCCRR